MSRTILLVAMIVYFAAPLDAAEIKWGRGTAAGDFVGNYSDPTKWDGGVVPGINDRARVDRGGSEMTLDSTIVANDFLFAVDEEPQTFFFLPTADVTLTSNLIFLNRGGITMDIQAGASLSVGGNFLLGQFDNFNMFDSDITVTIAGQVENTGKVLLGDAYDGEAAFTDILLDVTSGTLSTTAIEFAPNGDLDAFLGGGLENSMRRVGDGALISLSGNKVNTVTDQIANGFYFTESTQGTLGAIYDAGMDRTLVAIRTAVSCDFDGNQVCDGADIDLLVGEIASGTNDVNFDLTSDSLVNLDDRDAWLSLAGEENIGPGRSYLLGDANLDETVDGADFLAWNTNKFTDVAQWTAGDFNADGTVDGADFLIWNDTKFTSSDLSAVPEPGSMLLLLTASLLGVTARRRYAC